MIEGECRKVQSDGWKQWWEDDCKLWKVALWCVWKGVQANSVQGTVCKKWIHKWCSGVRSDLSRIADSFKCRRCDGTLQEADLAEELIVDEKCMNV